MSKDLIPINYDGDRPTVSARELHEFLEMQERYSRWFERMLGYGFEKSTDYNLYQKVQVQNEGGRHVERKVDDAQLTIDMAKELCMIQRTDRGKQARQYFLAVEKAWNDPDILMARALKLSDRKILALTAQLEDALPKVIFANAVAGSEDSISVGALAKLIRQNNEDIGRNRLFAWMRDEGWLIKKGRDHNLPSQRGMDQGLFELRESTFIKPDGTIHIDQTTLVTAKGQQFFIDMFLKRKAPAPLALESKDASANA